ncbi:hypothetical protein AB1Y20_023283 [Prymnesium parvum]|uniref:Palmitoyltransferase n=1 Tax=Prymnesium parvum TaxID=97485 RepID=A0AB34JFX0_PRYPA
MSAVDGEAASEQPHAAASSPSAEATRAPQEAPAAAPTELTTESLIASIAQLSDDISGKLEQASELVLRGTDANGATIGHWAALQGMQDVLALLHSKGVPLDLPIATSGMQPLHWACAKGQLQAVRFLVSTGCDINAAETKGQTPLMLAAQGEFGLLLHWLIQHGANLTAADNCGDTALHWAAYKNSRHCLAVLIEHGLKPEDPDSYGSTALHLAVGTGALHAVNVMLCHPTASAMLAHKDAKGRTPAMLAEERGSAELKALLEAPEPLTSFHRWFLNMSASVTGMTFGTMSRLIELTTDGADSTPRWFAKKFLCSDGATVMEREMRPTPPPA